MCKKAFFLLLIFCLPFWIAAQTFTFLHVTDCHVPYKDSLSFIRSLKNTGAVYLAPYNTSSDIPAFVVCTGDVTEFGGKWWGEYLEACKETSFLWYHTSGNHDNTWFSIRPEIRKIHSAPFYSFSYQGVHFIVLDSATPQDPRPSFGREQIVWLKKEVASLSPCTPLLVFFHHPPGTSEFASPADSARVLDILKPYNLIAFVVGHGHKPCLMKYNGFPVIMGGQGYGDLAGYNVFCFKDGYLRVAYRKIKDPNASLAIFEKKITQSRISTYDPALASPSKESNSLKLWEIQGEGAFKAGPSVKEDHVYAGALDGKIYAFHKKTGQLEWTFSTGGEILGRILIGPRDIFAASSDGKVYALSLYGSLVWSKDTGIPIYAPLAMQKNTLFAANREGGILALDASNGEILWSQKHADYTIETAPCIHQESLYVGAWDGYLYHYRISDGSICDKIQGVSSSIQAASRYYSPADCSPIVIEEKLYATDRGYTLGEWDISTAKLLRNWPKVAAISLSKDKKHLYLRQTTGELVKMKLSGEIQWSTPDVCDSIPTPANESENRVYICSGVGKLTALNSATGEILWQCQSSEGLRVYGEIAIDEDSIYIADMDGKIKAFKK